MRIVEVHQKVDAEKRPSKSRPYVICKIRSSVQMSGEGERLFQRSPLLKIGPSIQREEGKEA